MTEPTYEYVKGQGWVVSAAQVLTRAVQRPDGAYLITLEKRKPNSNERYFTSTESINVVMDRIYSWAGPLSGGLSSGHTNLEEAILYVYRYEKIL